MRRAASVALVALAFALTACGSSKASPGVATVDLKPTVELDLHGCPGLPSASTTLACSNGLNVTPASNVFDTPLRTVPIGTVMLVKNLSAQKRRVVGTIKDDQVFDTGIMLPMNETTIVLNAAGTVSMTEMTDNLHRTLAVRPRPAAKS
jgi:hypothetical protein